MSLGKLQLTFPVGMQHGLLLLIAVERALSHFFPLDRCYDDLCGPTGPLYEL